MQCAVTGALSPQRLLDSELKCRIVRPAELAATRIWVANWERMLPCVVANRRLLSRALLDAVVRFVTDPVQLSTIERESSAGDPKGDLRLYVSLDELEELIEYSIAAYNTTPHNGLNGRTPLEAMEYFVRGKHAPLNWLAEPHRRALCLMQSARRCTVRGYLTAGTRPHINLYGVRYTNEVLASSTPALGKKLSSI